MKYIQKQIDQVSSEKQNLETKIHCTEFSSSLAQKSPYLAQSLKRSSQGSLVGEMSCGQLVQCMDNKLIGSLMSDKQKRHRRRAALIDRHYQCPVQICSKNYGSEGSLN